MRKAPLFGASLFWALLCGGMTMPALGAGPAIQITEVPAYGARGVLSGIVKDGNPAAQRVAVFIYVGGGWYSKPSCAAQLTPVQPDGSWSANITPVASDVNATIIAALLVSSNYNQPCVEGAAALPLTAYNQALSTAYASRFNPAAKQLNFSDYLWWVKSSSGLAGPGPNYFSNSSSNVWVDASGKLHLKITNRGGQWQCAEIISARTFGYGQYRFTLEGAVNSLDPGVILGLFTWSNDAAFNNREIDVELTRWSKPDDTNSAQFAIQPASSPQLHRFPVGAEVTNSTYTFTWQPGRVDFRALKGDYDPAPPSTNILRTWTCQLGVPPAGGENIRFNFWLNKGNPPVNGKEVEIVLSRFEFVPLGPPQSARIQRLRLLNNAALLDVLGQADRRYQIHWSSNLHEWTPMDRVLATNEVFQFTDTTTPYAEARFYRTVTEP